LPNKITIYTSSTLTAFEKIPLEFQIIGAKNPAFSGTTVLGDFIISAFHPNGYGVNKCFITPQSFKNKKAVSLIYLKIAITSNFRNTKSDYTF
jgi:hypothetical protein